MIGYQEMVTLLLTETDVLLKTYIEEGYLALSSALRVPLALISGIYLAILGYSVAVGWVRLNIGNLIKVFLKIGFINLIVTDWHWVSVHVIDFMSGVITLVGNALLSASKMPSMGSVGFDQDLQDVLNLFTWIGSALFKAGSLMNIGPVLDGLVFWAFGYAMVGLGLFELMAAKVLLSVLFVLTPLMVLFCYFKPFQGLFDRWLGAITGAAFVQVLVTASLAMGITLATWWLSLYKITKTATEIDPLQLGNMGTLPIIVIGIACIGLILRSAHLANRIAGATQMMASTSKVSGFIGESLQDLGRGLNVAREFGGMAQGVVSSSYQGAKTALHDIQSMIRGGKR